MPVGIEENHRILKLNKLKSYKLLKCRLQKKQPNNRIKKFLHICHYGYKISWIFKS